jgi:hypothetical protein
MSYIEKIVVFCCIIYHFQEDSNNRDRIIQLSFIDVKKDLFSFNFKSNGNYYAESFGTIINGKFEQLGLPYNGKTRFRSLVRLYREGFSPSGLHLQIS